MLHQMISKLALCATFSTLCFADHPSGQLFVLKSTRLKEFIATNPKNYSDLHAFLRENGILKLSCDIAQSGIRITTSSCELMLQFKDPYSPPPPPAGPNDLGEPYTIQYKSKTNPRDSFSTTGKLIRVSETLSQLSATEQQKNLDCMIFVSNDWQTQKYAVITMSINAKR
jgi:hypothetical protein